MWFRLGVTGGCIAFAIAIVSSLASSPERQRVVTLGQREWTAEPGLLPLTVHKGQRIRVVAFRSGGGITSLLQEEPPALFEFPYDAPAWPEAEIWRSPKSATRRDLPVDLVAVTAEGLSVFVDRDGVVRTISVSGYRTLVKRLDPADSVTSACAIDLQAVAYVSALHPDTIFLTPLAPSPAATPLALDAEARGIPWSMYRFSGALGGACVLWSPSSKRLLLVSDSAIQAIHLPEKQVALASIATRVWRLVSRRSAHSYVADVTTFPGGIAVLATPVASQDGRLIDLYTERGTYIESVRLARRATRLAGAPDRLFALEEEGARLFISSYALPASVRSRTPARPPRYYLGLTPAWLRVLNDSAR